MLYRTAAPCAMYAAAASPCNVQHKLRPTSLPALPDWAHMALWSTAMVALQQAKRLARAHLWFGMCAAAAIQQGPGAAAGGGHCWQAGCCCGWGAGAAHASCPAGLACSVHHKIMSARLAVVMMPDQLCRWPAVLEVLSAQHLELFAERSHVLPQKILAEIWHELVGKLVTPMTGGQQATRLMYRGLQRPLLNHMLAAACCAKPVNLTPLRCASLRDQVQSEGKGVQQGST